MEVEERRGEEKKIHISFGLGVREIKGKILEGKSFRVSFYNLIEGKGVCVAVQVRTQTHPLSPFEDTCT